MLAVLPLACRATESFDPPRSSVLTAAEPLPVTLSNDLRGLRERDSTRSNEITFKIGRLFQRLFVARDGLAFLSAVTSHLDTDWEDSGGPWRATYSIEVHLQLYGTGHRVTARAVRSAPEPEQASREAIEGCMEDLYAQVGRLLRETTRPVAVR